MESLAAGSPISSGSRLRDRLSRIDPEGIARVGFVVLVVAAIVGFVVYPTYPNYDSYYSLLWGRELLHLDQLSFEAYRAPTEHPLAILFSAVLWPLGRGADRVMVFITLLCMVGVVAGVYRLAARAFNPWVGLIGALLMATRFDFPFLAVRGYIDIPYILVVLWAAILEYEKPRRGTPVFLLLVAAGLMRPEAWLLIGLYFLWMAFGPDAQRWWRRWWTSRRVDGETVPDPVEPPPSPSWRQRGVYLAWAVLPPLIWALTDLAVTGNPLYSLTATSDLAEELGRQRSLADVPSALPLFFRLLVKPPVLNAAILGILLGLWFMPRRLIMPGVILATGVGTFVLVGLAGLSVIDRYLIVAAVALVIFAALAVGGWTMLRRGSRERRVWGIGAGLAVAAGVIFTFFHSPSLANFDGELVWRYQSHQSLERLLDDPATRRAIDRRCGPVSTPSHKLIPEVRWIADLPQQDVLARSDPEAASRVRRGVAIYVQGGSRTLERQGFAENTSPLTQVPPPGFRRVATTEYYSVFTNCPD